MENLRASSGDAPKIIFAGAQILAAYSNLATDALPPNLRSFLQSLDFTSFDVVSATTLPCWDTRLGFFGSKLVFSTCTPAVCISAMWLVHLLRRAKESRDAILENKMEYLERENSKLRKEVDQIEQANHLQLKLFYHCHVHYESCMKLL